ncbi:hypothetical protein SAMN05216391_11914 [Lachnospiraceae bacterium KHCPX20]|nr:hypothetical protein SAMN05216391_11914 [Lachnospiraceae bacterium KHCPX20]
MATEKQYETLVDTFTNGAIIREYGSTHLISFCPLTQIDKVKVSIVKLGTNGKDCLDFFADLSMFRRFCDEIDNGDALKRLMSHKDAKYPDAYKWVSGKDGEKKLNIGMGKKGVLFQIIIGKNQKMTPISISALKELSFRFKLVTGLVPVTPNTYYEKLVGAFYKGEAARQQSFSHTTSKQLKNDEPMQSASFLEDKTPASNFENATDTVSTIDELPWS